jgi:hypothetical protein
MRRYAVADGASESSFAAAWASLLTQAYVHGLLTPDAIVKDLAPLQARWRADVDARSLPWYAAEKARAGAYAALAGLTLRPDRRWTALAAGDCCVFQVRGGRMVRSFPLEDPEAFTRRPLLIGSGPAGIERIPDVIATACGAWAPGDIFMLMSDAIAAYFLREVVTLCHEPLDVLPPSDRYSDTYYRVERLRKQGALRNDDVSLLTVQVRNAVPSAHSGLSTQDAGLR